MGFIFFLGLSNRGVIFCADFFQLVFVTLFRCRRCFCAFLGPSGTGLVDPFFFNIGTGQEFRVSTEQNIGPPAGHVRGNRHRTETTCLGNNICLSLVVDGIQDVVLDLFSLEESAQIFGLLD